MKTDDAEVDVNEVEYYQGAINTILSEVYHCCNNKGGFLMDVFGYNTKKKYILK